MIFDVQRVGPVDRPADADDAGRHHVDLLPLARRHEAHPAPARLGPGVLRDGDGGVRPRRALPDAGLRDDRPRPRHEQLDGRPLPLPREAARPRQGAADEGGARGARREVPGVRPLQGRRRRRHPVPHAARLTDAPAAAYFTRGSGHNDAGHVHRGRPTTTSATWTAWRASSRPRSSCVPKPVVVRRQRARRSGVIAYGSTDFAVEEARDASCAREGLEIDYLRLRALPVHARDVRRSSPRTSASTSSSRTATGRCPTCCASRSATDAREAALHPPLRRLPARRRNGDRGRSRPGRRR